MGSDLKDLQNWGKSHVRNLLRKWGVADPVADLLYLSCLDGSRLIDLLDTVSTWRSVVGGASIDQLLQAFRHAVAIAESLQTSVGSVPNCGLASFNLEDLTESVSWPSCSLDGLMNDTLGTIRSSIREEDTPHFQMSGIELCQTLTRIREVLPKLWAVNNSFLFEVFSEEPAPFFQLDNFVYDVQCQAIILCMCKKQFD
jgi:hypothetical protein